MNLPILDKLFLFLRLFVYWVFRKQIMIAKEILNSYVDDIEVYDEYVTNTDTGFVNGLLSQFSLSI